MADVIILGGNVAIEKASLEAGVKIKVPFALGRADATQEQTDVKSLEVLELKADGFRNYYSDNEISPISSLIDRAYMLDLTVPEMTALVGGMRVLNTNSDNSDLGVLTKKTTNFNK